MNAKLRQASKVAVLLIFLVGMAFSAQAQRKYRIGYKDKGFSVIPEASLLVPSNTYGVAFNFNVVMGGQFGPNFFAGAGVGLDAYESDLFVSGFANARYFFIADQFTPYVFIDAGYAYPIDVDPTLSGGPMITPGAGIRYFMSNTTAINLSLGYRFQSMPKDDGGDPDASTSLATNWIQSFVLRVGLQF